MFVVVTRAEPSVVRAGAMAAVGACATTAGRPLSRLRGLALAVTALVLVDPLLVRALGFRLSAAATAAIVVLAGPLARALPGPRWLAEPLGVTLAAQAGVAPFLVSAFGPLPVASIPANLLVVPAAGAVMAWGMSAGLLAGVVGGATAAIVHVPTRLLLWWVGAVAARAAAAPLGHLGGAALVLVGAGAAVALVSRRRWPGRAAAGAAVVAVVAVAALAPAPAPAPRREVLVPGVVRWHGGDADVVVLGGGGGRVRLDGAGVLQALREARVGAVDLLVAADGEVPQALLGTVADRHPVGAVLEPASVPAGGATVEVGGLVVVLVHGEDRLVVEAWPAPR
jgi:competence protein ComEC